MIIFVEVVVRMVRKNRANEKNFRGFYWEEMLTNQKKEALIEHPQTWA